MLKHLRIQNFAVISEAAIEFGPGLNILSGETGAGKSIVMDALSLILGARASSELIRHSCDEASVEALFELEPEAPAQALLHHHGLAGEDCELIVRRVVHRSGRNRIYINGNLAPIGTLQAITRSLVDLCSQHDQQLLSRPEEQLLWLDRFGGFEAAREELRLLHAQWREASQHLEALQGDSAQRAQRLDFLRFQLQELDEACLSSPTEDKELEAELKRLANAESLFAFVSEAECVLLGSEQGQPALLGLAGGLEQKARLLAAQDPLLAEAENHLSALRLHAEELAHFLRSYGQRISRDEERLEQLNARLALLGKLKRKYGPGLQEVLQFQEKAREELSRLDNHEGALSEAELRVSDCRRILEERCELLRGDRKRKARDFARAVERELAELHMGKARFELCWEELAAPGPTGKDSLCFTIAANPGEAPGPLHRIASGGELSRVMLAMHNVISGSGELSVFLFDEVDAGIGGTVAVAVGAKLRKVARRNQVICITHLPQVAAFAQVHLRVDKKLEKHGKEERTRSEVKLLGEKERVAELARMLGGLGNQKAAVANAEAMLELAREMGSGMLEKAKARAGKAAPALRVLK